MAANESICDQEKALEQVKHLIRTFPDFPRPGIDFKDICPILKDPSALKTVTDVITDHIKKNIGQINVIVGTLVAACKLVESCKCDVKQCIVLVELEELNGKALLSCSCHVLIKI
ncbi:hypothetical protein QZH41_011822 [Actinostola sp. cb2023]|nr:hypothetical protein QZH41_011822 [Actinostola sp. cb2023]